jgi:hypothetical protein
MSQAPKWITPAGSIGSFEQGKPMSVVFTTVGSTDFDLIAGTAPGYFNFHITTGTTLADVTTLEIAGTPFFFSEDVTNEFVLRAYNTYGVTDRTFTISITGSQAPVWETAADYLQVGPNLEPYALNKNRVDYLLHANAVGYGQTLRYYIAENDGTLPPGLVLDQKTGLISGYVNDVLTLDFLASKIGGYDGETYDSYPYDHAVIINNNNQGVPTSIAKIYQFYVTVTNGVHSTRRKFKIRVDDPNEFRADTTQITDDTTNFLAGIGYLIPPVWQNSDLSLLPNPSNLGTLRANTQQIIDLRVYDPYPFVGPVGFDWDIIKVNPEIALLTDSQNDLLDAPTVNLVGQNYIIVSKAIGNPTAGLFIQLFPYVDNASGNLYTITSVETYGNGYKLNLNEPLLTSIPNQTTLYCGTASAHPPGMILDSEKGILHGRLPYQPAYSRNYRFTIRITKTDQETAVTVSNNHIFNLTLKGDVETTINFVSTSSLGTLVPGEVCDLAVKAEHTSGNLGISYSLTGGKLPPGLTLTGQGNLTGIVPVNLPTESSFNKMFELIDGTTFDLNTTTFDRKFTFNVTARDTYLLSAVSKDFTIVVAETALVPHTNIYVKPFLSQQQRIYFKSLVSDSVIFDPALLYRADDTFFGVQSQIKMTLEYGIEKLNLDNYVPALTNYFKRRRYYFGEIKTATAVDIHGTEIYDVVYVDMIDDQMIGNNISAGKSFTQTVNGQLNTYYPDSVLNEQYSLETIQINAGVYISVDTQLRPKFMQSLQMSSGIPLGFVKAVILCYTLPNQGSKIIGNINRSGYDFKTLDFDVDRIVVEETADYVGLGPKYLVFGSAGSSSGFYIDTEDDQDIATEDGAILTL